MKRKTPTCMWVASLWTSRTRSTRNSWTSAAWSCSILSSKLWNSSYTGTRMGSPKGMADVVISRYIYITGTCNVLLKFFFFHSIKLVKEFNPFLNCAKKVVYKEIFSIWLAPILKDLPSNIKAIHCDKIEGGGLKIIMYMKHVTIDQCMHYFFVNWGEKSQLV